MLRGRDILYDLLLHRRARGVLHLLHRRGLDLGWYWFRRRCGRDGGRGDLLHRRGRGGLHFL